jgi:hydroxyacylglutathione hydrolase
MITIKSLTFNLFATNTFILSDESGECIIIDPACGNHSEEEELSGYIESRSLIPVKMIITHYHLDHILGIGYVKNKYGIGATAHPNGKIFWENADSRTIDYGLKRSDIIPPDYFINDGDTIKFGNSELEVIYVPGHADGSICLVNHKQKFVIAGDVLFYGSIGRTDLPTGDFDVLLDGIVHKLFLLDDSYSVYPGHGQKTEIGMERLHNPFIR